MLRKIWSKLEFLLVNFFLTSDIHFDYFRHFSRFLDGGTTTRLQGIQNVLQEGIKKISPSLSIFCGDILNRGKNIDPILSKFVHDFFHKLEGRNIVFPGNHDIRYTFGKCSSLLESILPNNIELITSPRSTNFEGGFVFHFLPFHPSVQTLKNCLEDFKIQYSRINILFSHFSVEKAKIRDDFSVSHKMEAIPLSLLRKFDYCFLGDIHLTQECGNIVFYPGSPLQHSFGEEGQEKYLWEIKITNGEVLKNRFPTNAPQFKTIVINTEEDINKILEEKKRGNFIRIESSIPLSHRINLEGMQYIEQKEEIDTKEIQNYRDVVKTYVELRDPNLLSILQGVL